MSKTDFAARVALAAVKSGLRPNPHNITFLASEIANELGDAPGDAAISDALQCLTAKYPQHFLTEAGRPLTESPRAPESASERLERANAQAAEREQTNAPKRAVVLSDKELALANKMTANQRAEFLHGIANARAVSP